MIIHFFQYLLENFSLIRIWVEILNVSLIGRVVAKLSIVKLIHASQFHFHTQSLMLVPFWLCCRYVFLINERLRLFRPLIKMIMITFLQVFWVSFHFWLSFTTFLLNTVLNHANWTAQNSTFRLSCEFIDIPVIEEIRTYHSRNLPIIFLWLNLNGYVKYFIL